MRAYVCDCVCILTSGIEQLKKSKIVFLFYYLKHHLMIACNISIEALINY